jgi:CRISPR-associated protein Csm1
VKRFRNTYTVFAGGDDFFLIGPWESTLALASTLQEKFAAYVVNHNITLSAGLVMTQPKTPVRHLARSAEHALEAAKNFSKGGGSHSRFQGNGFSRPNPAARQMG